MLDVRSVADAAELDAAGELRVHAYSEQGFLFGTSGYTAQLRRLGADRPDSVLVAVDPAEGLLGTVTLMGHGPDSDLSRDAGELELRALAVAPEAQGRGVGRLLVRSATGRARRAGARRLLLCTQARMHTAQRLYESEGFHRIPALDWVPSGTDIPLLAYSLDLETSRMPCSSAR